MLKSTNATHPLFHSIISSQWNIPLPKAFEQVHFWAVKEENRAAMFFLALRRKYIFSAIFAVLVTSLTNTISMAYVVEAYHKIHSTCVTVFPAAQMQGIEVQGRTGTFQWIFLHSLLAAFFTIIRWCWSYTKMMLKCFCNTWSLYYLKV